MQRRCPYCGEVYARLDRHLAGRVGCSAEARQRAAAAAAPAEADQKGRAEPVAPAGLGPAGIRLWARVVGEYALDPHQLSVLEAACREADAAEEADEAVTAVGRFVTGRLGQLQVHPGVAAGRAARIAMARLVKAATAPTEEVA